MARFVVVGAGIGGLATAVRLLSQGHAVTLFERCEAPGGRCNRIRAAGYTFDTGPTLLLMPDVLDELFASSGAHLRDYLDLVRVSPNYRITFGDGTGVDVGGGPEEMAPRLEALEPGAGAAYRAFLAEAGYRYRVARARFVERNFRHALEFASLPNLRHLLATRALRPLWEDIGRHFRDERLRIAFSFQTMYLGMSPMEAPAIYSLLPYTELVEGIWYPRGGMYSVVEALARRVGELGGRIVTGCEVERILTRNGRAEGVALATGERVHADAVVVNADLLYAYDRLLPREARGPVARLRHRRLRLGSSAFMLYLGIDRRYPRLRHHNVVLAQDVRANFDSIFHRRALPEEPSCYVNAPAAIDPSVAPAGGDALYVLVPVPHLGTVDWAAEAARFRDRVLGVLERRLGLTDLRERIVFERTFTPEDWRAAYRVHRGATFGISHDMMQVGYLRPANRARRVRGLYFVGASTAPGGGVPMVTLGARLVCEQIARDGYAAGPSQAREGVSRPHPAYAALSSSSRPAPPGDG